MFIDADVACFSCDFLTDGKFCPETQLSPAKGAIMRVFYYSKPLLNSTLKKHCETNIAAVTW